MLAFSYLLNIQVWAGHFAMWLKILLAVIAAVTTLLAFINQWVTFSKNYHRTWIVVSINHVFTFIMPQKKKRHYKAILREKNRGNNPNEKIENFKKDGKHDTDNEFAGE